jgi:hypothetical protein
MKCQEVVLSSGMIFHKGVNVVFVDTHGAANAGGGELLAPDEFLDGTRVYLDVVRGLFGREPCIDGACVWFLFLTHILHPYLLPQKHINSFYYPQIHLDTQICLTSPFLYGKVRLSERLVSLVLSRAQDYLDLSRLPGSLYHPDTGSFTLNPLACTWSIRYTLRDRLLLFSIPAPPCGLAIGRL